MSAPFIFSWKVNSAPVDESEVGFYQILEQDHSGDFFNIKVHVKHRPYFTQSQPQPPPLFGWFSHDDSMLVPSHELFENGSSYMQMYFPDHIIPHEMIPSMMPEVITYAHDLAQNCHSGDHYESPHFRLFTLVLDIVIRKLHDEHDDDITREPMGEVDRVPASKGTIESIKKVKLKKDSVIMESCRICLTEFDDGKEVSSMPCNHVYHQECLIQWLKTNHVCPLCRHPMPTSTTNS